LVAGIKKLEYSFYARPDVVEVAKSLLGKILVTRIEGVLTAARIVETEAYAGAGDKASHAYGNRRTPRTEVMFGRPGTAYIYLCYGIHHLFNVVTNQKGIPHAVLIRAAEPLEGIDSMALRRGKDQADPLLTSGPGNLSKALGLHIRYSGESLLGRQIYIGTDGSVVNKKSVEVSRRIGVDYALEDALLPYRFYVKGSPFAKKK